MVRGVRTWWRPLDREGNRAFVVITEDEDVDERHADPGYSHWKEVTPLEFYSALLEIEEQKPDPDDNWVETLEETIELWRKHEEHSGDVERSS